MQTLAHRASRRPIGFGLILLLAFVALAAGIGLRDPQPPDEPRFVLAAQQMIESGNWLLPHRGSELYAHKPPPFMWAQAAAYTLVRDWQVAFLLPSLLAGLATLWLVWDLTARLWGRRFAPWAALALLAILQFGLQAKRAQIDMLLVGCSTLALWALVRALLAQPPARRAWWLLGGFAAGLGTVTKGVGFLPLLVLLPAWWALRRRPQAGRMPGGIGGALIAFGFVLGAGVWLFPLLLTLAGSDDPELIAYAREILLRQTAERYADPWHHHQPAWYYLQVMFTLWLPGALLLPWLLPAWWRRIRRGDPRFVALLGWVALVLLFFSASPAKREVYIFPALPALCVAAAPLLPGLLRRIGVQRTLLGYVIALSALFVVAGALGATGTGRWPARLLADAQFDVIDRVAVWSWLAAIGVAGLLLAAWGRRRRAGTVALAFNLVLWTGYGIGLMPGIDPAASSRALMQAVGQRIGPDAELGLLAWREQQRLQADRPARDFGFERPWHRQWVDAGAWLAEAPERRWLLVLGDALGPCVDRAQAEQVGRANRRDWWLVPGSAYRTGCEVPAFGPDEGPPDEGDGD